ncbi:MAG: hypothetical protein H8D96_07080 [Desulfobacterales bacterium]|uniref:Uncharacterized protein n=1 Tax=Candidatus Desulfatibia vada TaxID=2841696 RepID=A0A8J6NT77_9BACT|nr:hypothetical protein [Candidatus Desulfatibia vada]
MNLLHHIKRKRAKQKRKQPIRREVFNQICSLVREYDLQESFLSVLDKFEDNLSGENFTFNRVRLKTPLESSLFSLATKDEYALTMSIIGKVDNAYLKFANSPEEILLCGPLYRLNPALTNQKLMRYHFETLLLHERAKASREI